MLKLTAAAVAAVAWVLLVSFVTPAFAQTGANVAVVINEDSPASVQIGEYYAKKRAVPRDNIIRISAPAMDEVSRAEFQSRIETPIATALARHGLQDRILYIVLTKGIPLRITGTGGQNGTAASLDSELTLLYRRMTGRPVPPAGFIDNPYYLGTTAIGSAKAFSHRDHDIFLVTRLDGFTVDDAIALVDRGMTPSSSGAIVLDQRKHRSTVIADRWLAEAAQSVRTLWTNRTVVLEETDGPVASGQDVIGYYSAGSPGGPGGAGSGLKFTPGALVASLSSNDARTFQPASVAGTPTLGDLLRAGATGAAGNVAEPYLQSSLRPQVLFPAYLSGFNLAEAFYLALPHLGWQSVVVGDPLCAPFGSPQRSGNELDPPVDPETELPLFFSKARLQNAVLEMKALPAKAVSLIVRAEARQRRGDKAGTRQALQEATELAPGAAAAQLQLAMMHEEDGETDQAIARYREIVKVEPNNVIALNNLAYSLAVRKGAPGEALPIARRALALAAGSPTIVDTIAWVEHLLGNDQEAVRLIEPVIRKSTGTAEIHLHAAVILAAVARYQAAEAQLMETLRLDPKLRDREDVKALRLRIDAAKK